MLQVLVYVHAWKFLLLIQYLYPSMICSFSLMESLHFLSFNNELIQENFLMGQKCIIYFVYLSFFHVCTMVMFLVCS